MLSILIYAIVAVLLLFILAGAAAFVSAIAQGRRRTKQEGEETISGSSRTRESRDGVRGSLHRYVGPVEHRHALLNAPSRVAIEFGAALCGFPGLGWLVSGKVVTGLVLLVAGPSFVWGAFPAYLVVTERIAEDPYLTIRYLPVLALASAASLAFYHVKVGRAEAEAPLEAEG